MSHDIHEIFSDIKTPRDNLYMVTLTEYIYVKAKSQEECDAIVCRSAKRWAKYADSEIVSPERVQPYMLRDALNRKSR